MSDLERGPHLLARALDEGGRLPTDPARSRAHQAHAVAPLDPDQTDALVLQLFASAPPFDETRPDASARPLASSWLALRATLMVEQGFLEGPRLD